jgi:hypothetical protein
VNQILHSILTSTAMPQFVAPEMLKSNWKEAIEVINQYNDPGRFTTLIAFEWTSILGGKNMHCNVGRLLRARAGDPDAALVDL